MFFEIFSKRKDKLRKTTPHEAYLLKQFEDQQPFSLQDEHYTVVGSAISDIGYIRENNEDNYILQNHINGTSAEYSKVSVPIFKSYGGWYLAGVFDGMGGGDMGEIASSDAANIFLEVFHELQKYQAKSDIDKIIRKAFLEANNSIVSRQEQHKIFGTTGTVLCTNGLEFKIYHIGDSRAYLLNDTKLTQITKDQTLAQMKIDVGIYREDDPSAENDKHKLTEYIGRDKTKENIRPDETIWFPILRNNRILLCSDGLYDMCTDETIHTILQQELSTEKIAQNLINAAKENGGKDNITCIVLTFHPLK